MRGNADGEAKMIGDRVLGPAQPAPPAGMGSVTLLGLAQSIAYHLAREPDGRIAKAMVRTLRTLDEFDVQAFIIACAYPGLTAYYHVYEEAEWALGQAEEWAEEMANDTFRLADMRAFCTDLVCL